MLLNAKQSIRLSNPWQVLVECRWHKFNHTVRATDPKTLNVVCEKNIFRDVDLSQFFCRFVQDTPHIAIGRSCCGELCAWIEPSAKSGRFFSPNIVNPNAQVLQSGEFPKVEKCPVLLPKRHTEVYKNTSYVGRTIAHKILHCPHWIFVGQFNTENLKKRTVFRIPATTLRHLWVPFYQRKLASARECFLYLSY